MRLPYITQRRIARIACAALLAAAAAVPATAAANNALPASGPSAAQTPATSPPSTDTPVTSNDSIQLQLSPRICTLAAHDKQCQTEVHAQWSAPHEESLCLVIVDRPDVRHCWEHYEQGTYNIDLTFVDDLTFQLRDPELQNVLASEVLRVIREALHYRHKRRDPWNIFE